jgi:hypothetical protein
MKPWLEPDLSRHQMAEENRTRCKRRLHRQSSNSTTSNHTRTMRGNSRLLQSLGETGGIGSSWQQ